MFHKLSEFIFILKKLVNRERNRISRLNDLLNKDLRSGGRIEDSKKYFSVVEISGDSILSVISTYTHLSMCYDYINEYEHNGLDIYRTLGIVYHSGNERLTNKKIANCMLVCIYGFISVETLRAISEKKDKFY